MINLMNLRDRNILDMNVLQEAVNKLNKLIKPKEPLPIYISITEENIEVTSASSKPIEFKIQLIIAIVIYSFNIPNINFMLTLGL